MPQHHIVADFSRGDRPCSDLAINAFLSDQRRPALGDALTLEAGATGKEAIVRRLALLCIALVLFGIATTRYAAHAQATAGASDQALASTQQASPNSLAQAWGQIKQNHEETQTIGAAIGYLAVIAVLFWFAGISDMLRDGEPQNFGAIKIGRNETEDPRRPFSLAQTQMTWWFALVLAAYLFLFLATGDVPALTGQALTLMGIGTGTALGAALVEQNKANAKQERFNGLLAQISTNPVTDNIAALRAQARDLAQQLASKNFLTDILTDVDGISLHRFQSFVWTMAIGAIFIVEVVVRRQLPEFDPYTLGVLGISAGTYLGFKIPETPA